VVFFFVRTDNHITSQRCTELDKSSSCARNKCQSASTDDDHTHSLRSVQVRRRSFVTGLTLSRHPTDRLRHKSPRLVQLSASLLHSLISSSPPLRRFATFSSCGDGSDSPAILGYHTPHLPHCGISCRLRLRVLLRF